MSTLYIRYPSLSGTSDVNAIGTIDGVSPSLNGGVISGNSLYFQSASATMPGLVNLTTQIFTGNKTFNGQVFLSDGLVGSPALAFASAGNTNTGLYLVGTDSVGFSANGVNIGQFSAAGLWTIGASGGSQTHAINGNLSATGTLAGSNFSGTSSGTNTGNITLGSFGASPAAEGASLSAQILTLQPASATLPGGVSTTTQTFAGDKSFAGNVNILTQGELRLQDTTGGEYCGLRAAGATTTHTLTMPSAAPAVGTYLRAGSATATNLEWTSVAQIVTPTDTTGLTNNTATDITSGSMVLAAGTFLITYGGIISVTNTVPPTSIQGEVFVTTSANAVISQASRGTGAALIAATVSRASLLSSFTYTSAGETIKIRGQINVTAGTISSRDVLNPVLWAIRIA